MLGGGHKVLCSLLVEVLHVEGAHLIVGRQLLLEVCHLGQVARAVVERLQVGAHVLAQSLDHVLRILRELPRAVLQHEEAHLHADGERLGVDAHVQLAAELHAQALAQLLKALRVGVVHPLALGLRLLLLGLPVCSSVCIFVCIRLRLLLGCLLHVHAVAGLRFLLRLGFLVRHVSGCLVVRGLHVLCRHRLRILHGLLASKGLSQFPGGLLAPHHEAALLTVPPAAAFLGQLLARALLLLGQFMVKLHKVHRSGLALLVGVCRRSDGVGLVFTCRS